MHESSAFFSNPFGRAVVGDGIGRRSQCPFIACVICQASRTQTLTNLLTGNCCLGGSRTAGYGHVCIEPRSGQHADMVGGFNRRWGLPLPQTVALRMGSVLVLRNVSVPKDRRSSSAISCAEWLQTLVVAGTRVIVPEIADYEVRRELIRANKVRGIGQLDALARLPEYLPITTNVAQAIGTLVASAEAPAEPNAIAPHPPRPASFASPILHSR